MENKQEEVKQQPQDLNNQLFQQFIKLNQEINELKAERQKEQTQQQTNSFNPELYNNNLKIYNNSSSYSVATEQEGGEQKTISQLKEEAKKSMVQQRNDFLSNQMYGDQVSKSYDYGNNKRYYHECAFINIYEQSDEKFKEIVGAKMEMLKQGDYWSLLNAHIQEDTALMNAYKGIEGQQPNRTSKKQIELGNLARNLIHKYNNFVNI